MRKLLVLLAVLLPSLALAQVIPVPSTNLSGTIATTNTFQSIQTLNNGRKGCTIQNQITNSHNMYVYNGAIGSATTAQSATVAPGQTFSCWVCAALQVITDQISITGTAGDYFYASFQ